VLNAQFSFEVYNHEDELIDNDSIIIPTVVNGSQVQCFFSIKNVSASQKSLKISMELLTTQIEESIHFICHPPTQTTYGGCGPVWASSSPIIILNSEETSSEGDFAFMQGPNSGVTIIRYKVYDVDNESDFVAFTVTYSALSSVTDATEDQISVFPNPAANNFVISNEFGVGSYVEIYNILGMQIKRINFSVTDEVKIDCSGWEKGYYFCRLYNDGKIAKTIKLTVTH
jgi:hypothetical protein